MRQKIHQSSYTVTRSRDEQGKIPESQEDGVDNVELV